jgi:pimeloyl-ACP methyl ester carboxylesterase
MRLLLALLLLPISLFAQCSSTLARSGTYGTAEGASGPASYVVYLPEPLTCFNGDVILFAHGYVPQGAPAGSWLAQLNLPDGTNLPALVNSFGFGFAASSFSKDGLAILQGEQDTKALADLIQGMGVRKFFAAGDSEGGVVAAKLVEDYPTIDGGIAVCGPVGDFQKQLDYIGDARVLFDYFFPGILTSAGGSPVSIPLALIAGWTSTYEPAIRAAVNSNPFATLQFISAANIPIGLSLSNAADAITSVLWYNVFGTNDANATLGGIAYDNIGRIYKGSFNNARMNAMVLRITGSTAARSQVLNYNTTGLLRDPLVTLHNLWDPVALYEQEILYGYKVAARHASSELVQIPALRFGHCNVTAGEAKLALLALLLKAGL